MRKVAILTAILVAGSALGLIALWGQRDLPMERLLAKYTNADSRFISIQGINVHYRIEGIEHDSIPLLLLHGSGASLHTWDGWVDELKDTERMIRLDLPAFGLTGPTPDRQYTMEMYMHVLVELLDKLGVQKVDVAGNSLGGNIAWYMAANAPDRVRKLILIDAIGYPIEGSEKPLAFRMATVPYVNKAFTFITPRFVVQNSVLDLYADKSLVDQALVDRYFELSLRSGNRQAFVDRANMTVADSSFRKISKINQHTLILWGSEDHFAPMTLANQFHRDLPNDTLIVMEYTGHMPMEESPRISAGFARMFLGMK